MTRARKTEADYEWDIVEALTEAEGAAAKKRLQAFRARQKNPDAIRWKNLEALYGMTKEQFYALSAAQGDACGICRRPASDITRPAGVYGSISRYLEVDHCHEGGYVRGLLCHKCNSGLGHLGDTVESIERVLDYVKRTRKIN
jgi:hypothetical protein